MLCNQRDRSLSEGIRITQGTCENTDFWALPLELPIYQIWVGTLEIVFLTIHSGDAAAAGQETTL